MKQFLLLILLSISIALTAQNVYLGYPIDNNSIGCGDKIYVNIPTHQDGRFIPNEGIELLEKLLNSNKNYLFHIKIYDFQVSSNLVYEYTDFICNNLKSCLNTKSLYDNYVVYSCGNGLAIFCFYNKTLYNKMNTRMEIEIECLVDSKNN